MDDSTDRRDDAPSPPSALAPHASPFPTSRLAPRFELVDVARQIEAADAMIGAVNEARLTLIAKQIRALQDEARGILERSARDLALHRAEARFVKRPGTVYHLFERANGERFFSLISPAEWGPRTPGRFVGSYRLENDQSFTELTP